MAGLIIEYGINGLTPHNGENHYDFLVSTIKKSCHVFDQSLGNVVSTSGFGWGMSVVHTYGLSFSGIQCLFDIHNINCFVADSLEKLRAVLALKDQEKRAFVTDKGLIINGENSQHAISVFVKRKGNMITVFDNDSEGNDGFTYQGLEFAKPKECVLQVVNRKIARQKKSDKTCYGYAIYDCLNFSKNPEILEELEEEFPVALKTLTQNQATTLSLKCQITIYKHDLYLRSDLKKVIAIFLMAIIVIKVME